MKGTVVLVRKVDSASLLKAMHELALKESQENRARLYRELLRATFLLPTTELPAKAGLHIADGKTSIQLIALKDSSGIEVTPVFTDQEALHNWDPNTPSISMEARPFFSLIVPLPIREVVINPFDPIRKMIRAGGRVTRPEFEALAKGIMPYRD